MEQSPTWVRQVLERSNGACANCGGTDRVRVKMIVPENAGGQMTETNGVALCRPCDMASGAVRQNSENRRLVNFWVSRDLYNWMNSRDCGYDSMGALIRALMGWYVTDESRYDDLEQYQDAGADVKVNVWVDASQYATFKVLADKRNLTVTDAFKALLLMFQMHLSTGKAEQ